MHNLINVSDLSHSDKILQIQSRYRCIKKKASAVISNNELLKLHLQNVKSIFNFMHQVKI